MRLAKTSLLLAATTASIALTACGKEAKQQLATLAHADSIRVDSLANVQKQLLEEVVTSTQFVNEINTELAKARSLAANKKVSLDNNAELTQVNEERKAIVARISHLVARLDSVQTRLAATRKQASSLSKKDSALVAQIAQYEKTVADMQASAEKQRAEFQATIDQQTVQIASLNSRVDTLTQVRTALVDTVGQLTNEKNTAYYVIGTREELIQKGILVNEGSKRFFLVGSRSIAPARKLDPSKFTKIDRLSDRTIKLPEGEYEILSRQDPTFTAPITRTDGRLSGTITIADPEQFWAPSRYLIIVRAG